MKSRKIVITALIVMTYLFQSCDEDRTCLHGGGIVNSYDLSLESFNRVFLYGPINLRITQGNEQSISIVAEPELYNPLEHKVVNEQLMVGYNDINCFDTDHGVWVNITVPDLTEIITEGKNTILSEGQLDLAKLSINTSGSATVELSGQVAIQEINSDGTITVNNLNLLTQTTTINMAGSCDINISCSEVLDVDVEGAAKIAYSGDPSITQKSEGSLSLSKLN